MPKVVDLEIYQGDDWAATVNVYNADGTPADLTGYTAQSQIRAGVADEAPDVAATMTCTVMPPSQVSLSLPHDQTTLMPGVNYSWDLQLTTAAGEIITIMHGDVTLIQEVTREAVA